MNFRQLTEKRRAFYSLADVEISRELIEDLAETARLAPSCFNKQPWRFVFVSSKEKLNDFFPPFRQAMIGREKRQ